MWPAFSTFFAYSIGLLSLVLCTLLVQAFPSAENSMERKYHEFLSFYCRFFVWLPWRSLFLSSLSTFGMRKWRFENNLLLGHILLSCKLSSLVLNLIYILDLVNIFFLTFHAYHFYIMPCLIIHLKYRFFNQFFQYHRMKLSLGNMRATETILRFQTTPILQLLLLLSCGYTMKDGKVCVLLHLNLPVVQFSLIIFILFYYCSLHTMTFDNGSSVLYL